jgi:hypothetical protein
MKIATSPTTYSSLVEDPLALDPLSPDPLSPIETRPIGDSSSLADEGDS